MFTIRNFFKYLKSYDLKFVARTFLSSGDFSVKKIMNEIFKKTPFAAKNFLSF